MISISSIYFLRASQLRLDKGNFFARFRVAHRYPNEGSISFSSRVNFAWCIQASEESFESGRML